MKFYTSTPANLKSFYENELLQYKQEYQNGNWKNAWNHLERAHIIGQKYPFPHSYAHFKMLQFGFKIKNGKEILGQIPRLIFGGVKSFVGTVPVGNPGGANVPPLKPFPIPLDLQELFEKSEGK